MFKKFILFIGLLLGTFSAFSQELPPKPNTLVTDYTNTLSADQKQQLENKLVAFNDSSSTQIAVVIIHSIGEYDPNDYAQKLGRAWAVGQKGSNNGIMVLVALDDHKMSIQVGYGLEGALPDVIASQIIRDDMTPRFKTGDYYGGLDAGTDDIIKYTKGEYKAEAKHRKNKDDGNGSPIGFIIIIVVVILIAIFRKRGGGGGGGHVIGSRGGASPFWWFLAGSALGRGSNGGGWGGFSGGGGGSSGGGGGFGGFGGGSFGGGGASGSW